MNPITLYRSSSPLIFKDSIPIAENPMMAAQIPKHIKKLFHPSKYLTIPIKTMDIKNKTKFADSINLSLQNVVLVIILLRPLESGRIPGIAYQFSPVGAFDLKRSSQRQVFGK